MLSLPCPSTHSSFFCLSRLSNLKAKLVCIPCLSIVKGLTRGWKDVTPSTEFDDPLFGQSNDLRFILFV